MAEIAVVYLVARLEDCIYKEANKKRAAKLTKLQTEFNRVRPFLKHADWRWIIMEDHVYEKWVTDVIDLACEIENAIDSDFCTKRDTKEFSVTSFMDLVGESINYFSEKKITDNSYLDISNFLERTSKKLKEVEIMKSLPFISLLEDAGGEGQMWHTDSFTRKLPLDCMVGRDKEIKILEEWLLNENVDTALIVAVTGTIGIGKTAMSSTVFDHLKIHFDCAAWIYVTSRPAIDLLRDMYTGFHRSSLEISGKKHLDDLDEEELTKIISSYLVEKKFLLVVDDLDALDAWEYVKRALPLNCKGKVVVTTRNPEISAILCHHVLHLEPLSTEDSLILLRRRSCWQQYDLDDVLWPSSGELLVEEILQICQGQPLVIATIGGMLSTVNIKEPKEWDKFLGILRASVGSLCQFNIIQKALLVSYFSLQPMLKCCLLYCGIFPLHHEISCKKLIRAWVAEGFIEKQLLGMTAEEIGKLLLDDLIRRNLLEVARVGANGEVVSCRLLRLMQHFILKTLNRDYISILSNELVSPSKVTRILVIHGVINNLMPGVNTNSVRSLLLVRQNGLSTPSVLQNSFSNIKFLRVLELQNSPIDVLPDSIGDLVLLRYINLRGTRIHNIPPTIKSLRELQTLDIRDTCVRALPGGIDGLKMLRHLLLADSFSNRLVKLDGDVMFCKDLQTLAGIKLTQQIAYGLPYLPQLLKLSVGDVEGRATSLQLSKSIDMMKNLNSLTIKCAWRKEIQIQASNPLENLEKLRISGWIKNLLGWVCRLKSLKYLYLRDCMLIDDPVSSLQGLPSLCVLSLYNAYKGSHIHSVDASGFPNLKELSLQNLAGLEEWMRIEEGSMRSLYTINIAKCPLLKLPPKGMENLANLQKVQVKTMPAEFIMKTRELLLHTNVHFSVVC
ncbi:hypothetical protein DCAR_0208512 [Daucus carota subsp. sativus]|uniref:Uncharacterized protein n=1 Tax=Daucus carota subsp. sativus TaxID=79200 RepID=A0A162AW68_DAUCS|nr:PREDICTED: disease resistance protein RPM1-like [Daucus carota subsp. sativus]WOG89275.1 hypothetical protein DCAR_0208512 [Daucus carota subsp. sativus]